MINLGKSCFLYYVLLFRLCSGKPTAFQLPSSFVVFQESGITIHNIASWNPPDVIPLGSWALTDSNGTITMPCYAFLSACGDQAQLVQASPPKSQYYQLWTKETTQNTVEYVMDNFSFSEFIALGLVHST